MLIVYVGNNTTADSITRNISVTMTYYVTPTYPEDLENLREALENFEVYIENEIFYWCKDDFVLKGVDLRGAYLAQGIGLWQRDSCTH